jgi:hypothetical protein
MRTDALGAACEPTPVPVRRPSKQLPQHSDGLALASPDLPHANMLTMLREIKAGAAHAGC